jgi:hypothetical protein
MTMTTYESLIPVVAANSLPASLACSPHATTLELDRLEAQVWRCGSIVVDALLLGWNGHVGVVVE